MAASSAQVLSPGAGWAVVIALGIGFAVVMLGISVLQQRYTHNNVKNNDEFMSASRSVKPGLIASGIVSAWTWAATLLQSSAEAFKNGVSGPYWYAAGATVQVLLFSMLGNRLKRNAPFASTYLQVIQARWGELAHFVFGVFAITTNVLVGSMLVLGGSGTVNQLTGMPILAALFITPISVAVYALVGGMRSTLLADYSHTVVLVTMILSFAFVCYSTNSQIGSPREMARLLTIAGELEPVSGNAGGSYLTFRSLDGFLFGLINTIANMAPVFCDQSYAQRAIASGPQSSKAFMLGGIAWFAVPMTMASGLGLAARALIYQNPKMAILSADEVSAGLPAPAAAAALMGKSGACAMLILLYLAVTSATAAQLVAVSSLFSYDVVKTLKKDASPRLIFLSSHFMMVAWAIIMAAIGVIWHYVGVSMGWLYTMMGIAVAPAVIPIAMGIGWKKANKWGCIAGALLGLVVGLASWLTSTLAYEGAINLTTTSANIPLVIGNLLAFLTPALVVFPTSLIWPENFTFEATRAIGAPEVLAGRLPNDQGEVDDSHLTREQELAAEQAIDFVRDEDDKAKSGSDPQVEKDEKAVVTTANDLEVHNFDRMREPGDEYVIAAGLDPDTLEKEFTLSAKVALGLIFVLLIFIPCMGLTKRIWTAAGLAAWISIMIAWLFVTAVIVILLPIWESRAALSSIFVGIFRDASRRHQD